MQLFTHDSVSPTKQLFVLARRAVFMSQWFQHCFYVTMTSGGFYIWNIFKLLLLADHCLVMF